MKATLFFILLLTFPILSMSQEETFQSLSAKGNEFIDKVDYKNALLCFEKALNMCTDNQADIVWTASLAGICAQHMEDFPKAFSLFEIAIKNNCKDIDVYTRGLLIAEQLNDPVKEEQMLLAARKNVDGAYKTYTTRLLNLYFRDQQFDKAISVADELLLLDATQTQVIKIKGFSLIKIGKQNEAIPIFETILAANPKDLESLMQLGLIYYERGSLIFDKAKENYKSIKNPTQINYTEYRMQNEKSGTDYRKAIPYLEKAYQIKPDDGLKNALFKSYSRTGNVPKANQFK